MVEQLRRPTEQVEVFWFSEQPNGYVTDEDLNKYDSGRLGFPNTYFDPRRPTCCTTSTMSSMPSPMRSASTAS